MGVGPLSAATHSDLRTRRYLTVAEVAKVLDVPVRTVKRWCKTGILTAVQAGPRCMWRVPIAAICERFAVREEDIAGD